VLGQRIWRTRSHWGSGPHWRLPNQLSRSQFRTSRQRRQGGPEILYAADNPRGQRIDVLTEPAEIGHFCACQLGLQSGLFSKLIGGQRQAARQFETGVRPVFPYHSGDLRTTQAIYGNLPANWQPIDG